MPKAKKRAPDRIEIPRELYTDLKRIAWECAFADRVRYVPLEDIILSAYLSGLEHGMTATEMLIEAESKG